MICLSKADESFYQRLTWNQAPSPLAAMNTTRQDLNGISNLREHVDAGQDDGSGGTSGSLLNSHDESNQAGSHPTEPFLGSEKDAGRLSRISGLSSYLKTVDGGDDQIRLHRGTLSSCASHIWSWTVWVLSVLVVSTIISSWNSPASAPAAMTSTPKAHESVPLQVSPLRKRSTCETGGVNKAEYNTPLHVGALFIILCVSTLACAFPIMATKFPGLRIPTRFFFAVRHFGTGVLIATAFVHLLPTAFISLGDPCLSSFWNQDYPAMPGAIALAAIFLVTVIEMVFHPSRHVSPAEITSGTDNDAKNGNSNSGGCMGGTGMLPIRDMGPIRGRSSSIGQGLSVLNSRDERLENLDEEACEDDDNAQSGRKNLEETSLEAVQMPSLTPEQQQRKELLQCVLLELGILFHSVFIGMALSVSIGNEFIILLIAIVFHQTFEGLALGSRIASVKWPQGKMQPWFMALAYGCTTPLGQAIGLATHTLYSPNSETGLIVVGVMNAISAGLLTFASLVELLSQDFLSDESWRFLRGRKRIYACLLVFFGAFFMSLVGAWA
ncbi:Zinc-regulated transporter 2 [Fusarium oxysporum f. sp. cubense]|uniref:Zinc-regulated transporter 2 n=1 Tax=Fusarium oxysporum f. sp. cubense TaxID=61366 RepID=A0A559LDY6_FUSOC|nr:Zinc-regulated transporter 2 [Fusarium oxysporum f. sp. cubense]